MRRFWFAVVMCALAPTIAIAQQETPQAKECTACQESAKTCQQCTTAVAEPACCAASQQVVMYSFTADWCGPCKVMKETVFADKEVAACLQENCKVVTVNIDEDQATTKKFEINAIPTQIFVSADGKVIKKLVGSTNKEKLIAAVKESAAHAQAEAQETKQATITLTAPKLTVKKSAEAHVVAKSEGNNVVTFTVNGKPVTLQAHTIRIDSKNGEIRLESEGTKLSNPVAPGVIIKKELATQASDKQHPEAEVEVAKVTLPHDIVFVAPKNNVQVHEIQRVVKPGVIEHIIVKRVQKPADGEEVELEIKAAGTCPAAACANCDSATKCAKCSQCPHSHAAHGAATATLTTTTAPTECPAGACPTGVSVGHCTDCGQCPFAAQTATGLTTTCPAATCPASTCPASACPASTCPALPLQAATAMGAWNRPVDASVAHSQLIVEHPHVIRPSEEIPEKGAYCVVTTTGQRHSYAGEFVRMTDDFIIVKENGTTHWIPRNNVECLSVTEEKIASRPGHPVSATRATVFPHPIALPYSGSPAPVMPSPYAPPTIAHPAMPAQAPRTEPVKNVYHIDLTLKHGDEVISHPQLMTLEQQRACVQVGSAQGFNFYAGVEVREISGGNNLVLVQFFDQADKRSARAQMVCENGETMTIPWPMNDKVYELVVKVDEHGGNQSCCQQASATTEEATFESAEGVQTNFEVQLPKIKK